MVGRILPRSGMSICKAGADMGKRTQIVAMCAVLLFGGGAIYPEVARAQSDANTQVYAIPAGNLNSALRQFSQQSRVQLIYPTELAHNKKSAGLFGSYTAAEALRRLLDGSGLVSEQVNDKTVVLRKAPASIKVEPKPLPKPKTRNTPTTAQSAELETKDLEKITVTGTRIRGAQLTSPLVTISQEDMVLSGHNNLGQALRALPQNFSGGQNPGVVPGSGGLANQNVTNSSSANLRGLGADATLTLLNGVRMAYDGYIQAVDLSVVPTAAIDRVEVLLDGASAIYGSDAVGGVVNIILKRDYDGAELSARYGTATDGGYAQTQFTGIAGTTWASGGFLISADSARNKNALASQRDYLDYLGNPELSTIYPEASQVSTLFSGHQELGSRAELLLDAYYLDRTSKYGIEQSGLSIGVESKTSNYGVAPSMLVDLGREWSLRLLGYSGRNDAKTHQTGNIIGQTDLILDYKQLDRNETHTASLELEGSLFESSAGQTRLSLGGGWKESKFEEINRSTGTVIVPGNSNSSRYGYAEIDLPLVGGDQEVKFVSKLSLNGALRYEHYDSFGSETTPKLGVFWGVTDNFDVRASWGKSFKAPTLYQQYNGRFAYLWPASRFGVTDAPPSATVLRVIGGNPNLDPERAETTTAGIVFRPSFLPGLTAELGWFDIDYTERVVRPLSFASQALFGPTLDNPAYSNYSVRNPSAELQSELISSSSGFSNLAGVAYDPAAVVAFFDDREVNASSQVVRGIDLSLQYATPGFGGALLIDAKGSWLTDARRSLFDGGPESETAGVLGQPPKFKGLLGVSWSKDALTLAATMNHIGGIRNVTITPSPMGDAMTTLDLVVDYRAQPSALGGFGFNLAIINALNQRPPYLQPSQPWLVNYDSTNYSAVGRVVSLTVSKKF